MRIREPVTPSQAGNKLISTAENKPKTLKAKQTLIYDNRTVADEDPRAIDQARYRFPETIIECFTGTVKLYLKNK